MSDGDDTYEQYEAYNRDSVYEQYTETKGEKNNETVSQEQNTYEVPYNDQIYTEYNDGSNRSTKTFIQTICKDEVRYLSQHKDQM